MCVQPNKPQRCRLRRRRRGLTHVRDRPCKWGARAAHYLPADTAMVPPTPDVEPCRTDLAHGDSVVRDPNGGNSPNGPCFHPQIRSTALCTTCGESGELARSQSVSFAAQKLEPARACILLCRGKACMQCVAWRCVRRLWTWQWANAAKSSTQTRVSDAGASVKHRHTSARPPRDRPVFRPPKQQTAAHPNPASRRVTMQHRRDRKK
jgi:hypothetical protein